MNYLNLYKCMTKTILIVTSMIIIGLILIASLIAFFSQPICEGRYLGFLRPYAQFFNPPEDLFTVVLDEKLDISPTAGEQTFAFKLKYVGKYSIGLVFRDIIQNPQHDLYEREYDLEMELRLDFFENEKLLASKTPTDNYDSSWGFGRGKGNIECELDCPDELTQGTGIICKVTIIAADEYLASQSKDVRLVVQKISEE